MLSKRDNLIIHLYCKLRQELLLYARQYCPSDAEDVVHQAFMNCYERIDPSEDEPALRSYLYTTVKHLCLNFIRNQKPVYTDISAELSVDFVLVDTNHYIYEYINKLPVREREILTLSLQGFSTQDIAKELHMNFNTVRHYKKDAYAKIRNALQNDL